MVQRSRVKVKEYFSKIVYEFIPQKIRDKVSLWLISSHHSLIPNQTLPNLSTGPNEINLTAKLNKKTGVGW